MIKCIKILLIFDLKILYTVLVFISMHFMALAQSTKQIDSINNISIEKKIKNAVSHRSIYLANAAASSKLKYQLGEASSYSNLAIVSYYLGNYDDDLLYSLKAISIYENIKATEKLAFEYGELGYRMKRRNLPKAIFYMQKAKSIAENNNFQKPLLSIYNNYGVLKEMLAEYDSAMFFYKKGLTIKKMFKDTIGIPYSLNNIAGVYLIKKEFSKAAPLFNEALRMRIAKKDQIGIAENYAYLGDLYAAQNLHIKAIENYNIATKISLQYNYLDNVRYCYKMISLSYEALNNNTEALKNYKLFTIYKDSILNKDTNAKIAELDIQFETSKKEKQIIRQQADAKQRNITLIALGILAVLLLLIGLLVYRQQQLKIKQQSQEYALTSAIARIESQNNLHEQRLSISRDLHDNIGAQLTFIISSVENIKYAFDITNDKLSNKLTNISSFAKDTILELRDTIWAMNSSEILIEDLEIRINNYIEKAQLSKEEIVFSVAVQDELKSKQLSSLEGMNVYRTVQEAVNNAIKYAEASIVSINIKKHDDLVAICIKDNGSGFDINTIEMGNGLKNMQKRIDDLGGKFSIDSNSEGTKIDILI